MKVSMFGTLPPLKGNAYYCWGLTRALSRRIPVEMFSFKRLYPDWLYPGGTRDDDPAFAPTPTEGLTIHYALTYYNPLSWFLCGRRASGDVAHAQWWSLPVAPVWVVVLRQLRRRARPVLLTVHNVEFHEKGPLDRLAMRAVFSLADAFCVHTEENRKQLWESMNIPPERIHVVPMPVVDMYRTEQVGREAARERLGIEADRFVVLIFGNQRKYKGTDDFLEAVALLPAALRRQVTVVIAGQAWGDAGSYDEVIHRCGLDDQVMRRLQYVPMSEVKYYYESADLVALPYKGFSAQSGVGSIALAFGKPLLVTRVGGLPSLVRRPEAVAEPENVESLRDALAGILDDGKLLEKLAADSREVAAGLTWDAAAERTVEIYRGLLRG